MFPYYIPYLIVIENRSTTHFGALLFIQPKFIKLILKLSLILHLVVLLQRLANGCSNFATDVLSSSISSHRVTSWFSTSGSGPGCDSCSGTEFGLDCPSGSGSVIHSKKLPYKA